MSILNTLIERARKNPKVIVLPEGQDPRVVVAANKAVENKVVSRAIVLGSEAEISDACAKAGVSERKFECLDYLASDLFADFAAEFCKMREKKGMTPEKAAATMKSRIYFGAMMCRRGLADGLVAGSIASTADMLRAAFHCIGTAPGIKIASSCFVMDLKTPTPSGDDVLLFADCGVNPNPDAGQLVDIALATSATYRSLLGGQPKVAFLSFSTKGSADHEILNKVKEAHAPSGISLCYADHEPQVSLYETLLGSLIALSLAFCKLHLLIGGKEGHGTYLLKVHTNRIVYVYSLGQ